MGQGHHGIGCAVMLFVIRTYNNSYPEGCSFAILFMNVLSAAHRQVDHAPHLWRGEAVKAKKSEAKQGGAKA